MTQIKAKLPIIGDYYGNPSKRFRFKGRVPTFGDLPNENGRIFNGDTYYVIDEDETYYFDEGEFKKVEISIDGGGGTSFEDLGYAPFSAAEAYAAGDVVIYGGKLYKFTAAHTGAWIGTDAKQTSVAESVEEGKHPYISLERLREYLYRVTFDKLPADNGGDNPVVGGCSSFVKDGKLYRNLDFKYDNAASFIVRTKDFEGMSFITGLNDGELDDALIAQLPYRVVDGINNYGIKVSTHVLFNDWQWTGAGDRSVSLTRLPYMVLSRVKSMATIAEDLDGVLGNVYASEVLQSTDYLLQVLVTDGTTTYALMPPMSEGQGYVLQDITANPKLANFRWVSRSTVTRSDADLQTRPTGVERYNLMPCPLEELRFTKAYEAADRLSEFIGIDGTTKASTDEELTAIYEEARAEYLVRQRDGETWQTMHSVIYGDKMESLYIQENWDDNVIPVSAESLETIVTEIDSKIADNASDIEALRKMVNGSGAVEEFDATRRYLSGTYVIYEGYVYRFEITHEAGQWNPNDVIQTSAFNELMNYIVGDVENIYVQVMSSDSELDVEGIDVVVTFEDGSATQILTTDSDGKCSISVGKGKVVTMSVADKLGYQHVSSVVFRAVSNSRFVYFNYETEITGDTCTLRVQLVPAGGRAETYSEFVGKTVNLILSNDTSRSAVTDDNNIATFENVTRGINGYTVNPKVTGFVTPSAKTFDTNSSEVDITLTYNAITAAGIFMVNQDGDDVAFEAWDTADTLVAIHVATQELAESGNDYYMPVEEMVESWYVYSHNKAWATLGVNFPNVPNWSSSNPYYNGYEATQNMIKDAATLECQTPGAEFAVEQRWTLKGITAQGYIGTRDQIQILFDNYEIITLMLFLEGLTAVFKSKTLLSSSDATGGNYVYSWNITQWTSSNGGKTYAKYVIPFYSI